MWREWFSAKEIVAARSDALPSSVRSFNRLADREGWRHDPTKTRKLKAGGRGRPAWQYHISLLPLDTQFRLILIFPSEAAISSVSGWQKNVATTIAEERSLWHAMDAIDREQFIERLVAQARDQ